MARHCFPYAPAGILKSHGMTMLPGVAVTVDLLGIHPFLLISTASLPPTHSRNGWGRWELAAAWAWPGWAEASPGWGMGMQPNDLQLPEPPRQGASVLGSVESAGVLVLFA